MSDYTPGPAFNDNTPLDEAVPSQSNYVKKEECGDGILVEIAYMTRDDVDGGQKGCLHFNGDVKPLLLNPTNRDTLMAITGATTTGELRGKQIVLFNDLTVTYPGRPNGGVRIRSAQLQTPVSHVPTSGAAAGGTSRQPDREVTTDYEDIPY